MALCDHHIFGSGMSYTDPWPCSEMDVISQFKLRVVDENLIRGKVALIFLSQEKEMLLKMHLTRCYDMPNIEFGLATLRAKVRVTVGVETLLYPMAKKSFMFCTLLGNITRERGLLFTNLQESMQDFYGQLEAIRCMCFTDKPIHANYTVVRGFYANATETDFSGDF
ncbi:hypothetical protein H5410_005635 [Solanum commersonii]|uniref:Uncharacterized protein n=1 Tax=Solanum commersonii TaxID=4109 RepID=A0A9J6A7B4_SOLCO|nr:hypothetical protein H5410_005635 [Solanum commersonii]